MPWSKLRRALLLVMLLLVIWQVICHITQLPSYILPSPLMIAHSWQANANLIARQAIPTIIETLLGLLLGCLFGMLAAICLAYSHSLKQWFLPLLLISQALPTFAIAPLLVIWFGYGMTSKIVCCVIMIFFPITSNCYDGLRQTPQAWLDIASTMNASRWQCFLKVRLPAALPQCFSGLKIAASIAPIGAVIGEWLGSSKGLGFLLLNANARMEISLMFATLFTLVILTLCLYYGIDRLSRHFVFWQTEEN